MTLLLNVLIKIVILILMEKLFLELKIILQEVIYMSMLGMILIKIIVEEYVLLWVILKFLVLNLKILVLIGWLILVCFWKVKIVVIMINGFMKWKKR